MGKSSNISNSYLKLPEGVHELGYIITKPQEYGCSTKKNAAAVPSSNHVI